LELIVALTIFTMIGTVLVGIFISGVRFYSQEQSQLDNQQNLTTLSAFIENDMRQSTTMVLSSGCLSLSTVNGTVVYCHNSTAQTLTRNGSAIASGIASLSFTIELNRVRIVLVTVADQRGITNTLTQDYILREGNY
jgi:hypothetical protein